MSPKDRTYTCIVASKSDKTAQSLAGILRQSGFTKVLTADSASKIRRMVAEKDIDVIIINTPLADDFGTLLAMDMADKNLGVILLVKGDMVNQTAYKMEKYGAVTLGKPVVRVELIQSLAVIKALLQKIRRLDNQRQSLEGKMKEIRLVNRAKWLLIKQLAMTEEEAHRYIEKTAMDTGEKKSAVAENIISTYEV